MTTINAESLLKSLAFNPGRLAIGELYPAIDHIGFVANVATTQTAWRTIWPMNALYTFSTVPENMYVSSSSAADIGRIIFVAGLDANFNQISGYGITNGYSQSIITTMPGAGTPLNFFRVNYSIDITPALAIHYAAGNIYIAASDPAPLGIPATNKVRNIIVQGESRRSGLIYTVPANHALMLKLFLVSQIGDQQIIIRSRSRVMLQTNGSLLYIPDVIVNFAGLVPGTLNINIDPCVPLPEKTDITFEARGTSPVSGTFSALASCSLIRYTAIKNLRLGSPRP